MIEHQDMVRQLLKPGLEIINGLTPQSMNLLHCVSKLCSEAGELMDATGKLCYYGKPLDVVNCKEELGDIEFYLEGARQAIGVTREECLKANMMKLSIRYPNYQFSNQHAQERKDKLCQ